MNRQNNSKVLTGMVAVSGMFALILVCSGDGAKAQVPSEIVRPSIPADAAVHINVAESVIHKAHPEITQATINHDKVVIGNAFPMVWGQSSTSTLNNADTARLLATVWKDYRDLHPGTEMDAHKVTELAKGYGGLHVTTTPAGANIWLDGKQLDGTTEQLCFTRSGSRKVKVGGLANYKDEEATVDVVAADTIEFSRKLKLK